MEVFWRFHCCLLKNNNNRKKQSYFKVNQIPAPKTPHSRQLAHVCEHKESVKPALTLLRVPEARSRACVQKPTGTAV